MLDTQYRMHPSISAFPNRAFYASALMDGTISPSQDGSGSVLPGFEPPVTDYLIPGKNVTFIDHDHPESAQMSSLANYGDAAIVCNVIADLLYNNPVSRFISSSPLFPFLLLKHVPFPRLPLFNQAHQWMQSVIWWYADSGRI